MCEFIESTARQTTNQMLRILCVGAIDLSVTVLSWKLIGLDFANANAKYHRLRLDSMSYKI